MLTVSEPESSGPVPRELKEFSSRRPRAGKSVDYRIMTPDPAIDTPTRRRVLTAVVAGAVSAIGGALAAVSARFLGGVRRLEAPPAVPVGPAAALAGSPVEAVLVYSRPDGYRTEARRDTVYLLRQAGEVIALSTTCTHLGCSVRWDAAASLFRCPCHGGTYRADGSVAGGPPPLPLRRLPIEIRSGQLYVRPEESS